MQSTKVHLPDLYRTATPAVCLLHAEELQDLGIRARSGSTCSETTSIYPIRIVQPSMNASGADPPSLHSLASDYIDNYMAVNSISKHRVGYALKSLRKVGQTFRCIHTLPK